MRTMTGILAAGLIVSVATAASAETNGWYAGGEAGLNLAPQAKFEDGVKTWRNTQDPGYGLLGQVGYGFGQYRLEGEIGWRSNSIDKVKTAAGSFSGGGSLGALDVMANAYYDVPTGTAFTPYLGAGVGGVDVNASKIRGNGVTYTNDDNFVFGYQGIAGVAYAINDQLSLKADYRYLRTVDARLNEDPSWGTSYGKGEYAAHSIMVGFTYKFGAPAQVAAAPAPLPPPAPTPAPAPAPKPVQAAPIAKNYLVFFDFNKSSITPEARRIIEQAAKTAKGTHSTAIHLTGHTDAVGSDKYNMALSIRRANAVKAELVKLGIPANEISVVGKGKTDLLVPTKDGVREPQNRRVQIVVD